MEQYSHNSVWVKSNKHFQGPTMINRRFKNSSWEEQAFAYDSGFVWPPRSYSCSFCKREFRSAQALGGHMNVHRRDRARLKQSLSPRNHQLNHNPSQVCDENPKLDPTGNPGFHGISPHGHYSPSGVSQDSKTAVEKHTGRVDHKILSGSHKRHKITSTTTVSSSFQRCCFQSDQVLGLKTGSFEELDLELRLGDPPKVK